MEKPKLMQGYVPEEIDYKPMVDRALLINDIREWYYKKFKGINGYRTMSVFDLIADFIIDTNYKGVNDGKK